MSPFGANGFYEFTAPTDAAQTRKDKWLFTKAHGDWGRWLDPAVPAAEILQPPPAGSFMVEPVA